MNGKNIAKEKNNYMIDSIMRWLLFGILIVVIPPLYVVWYKIIIKVEVIFMEYIPDALLAMLSVCCNLINTCVDGEKKIARILRWILGIILGLISLASWGLFFMVRFEFVKIDEEVLKILFYSISAVIVICAIIGGIIEWYNVKFGGK